jgi:hypothetical protein
MILGSNPHLATAATEEILKGNRRFDVVQWEGRAP